MGQQTTKHKRSIVKATTKEKKITENMDMVYIEKNVTFSLHKPCS